MADYLRTHCRYVEKGLTNFCRVDIINVGGFTETMKVRNCIGFLDHVLQNVQIHAKRVQVHSVLPVRLQMATLLTNSFIAHLVHRQ